MGPTRPGTPFPFEGPVPPELLIDRAVELDLLARRAADRVGVRLVAPRRYGKTSLVLAHAARLGETGWRTVHVDFSRVADLTDVARRLAAAYAHLDGSWIRSHLGGLLARLGVSLSATGPRVTVGAAAAGPGPPARRGGRLRPARPPEDALGPRRGRDARRARRVPGPARRPQGPRRPAALAHPVPRRRRRVRLRGIGAVDDARALRHARAPPLRPGGPVDDRAAPARRDDRRPRAPLRGRGPGPRPGARRAGRVRRRAPAADDAARLPAGRRADRRRGADAGARRAGRRRRA